MRSGSTGRKAGGAAVASSSQLGLSTRARTDAQRKVGTANAVAAGADLTRAGILSDRELEWIRRLAYGQDGGDHAGSLTAAEQTAARRKQLSDARVARWPDTVDARQAAFLQARQEEKDNAEKRRVALDELYAQQREEERLSKVAALELKQLKEDPRGRNAASTRMLHDAMKAREEQIAFMRSVKEAEAVESAQERDAMLMAQWGATAAELQQRLATRERNMAEKNYNLEMVLFQIDERKKQRGDEKSERARVEEEAADEARENAEETAQRRERDVVVGACNRANARPALSKTQQCAQRVAAGAALERERAQEEEKQQQRSAATLAKQRAKEAVLAEQKRAATESYVQRKRTDSPKRRTQDRFEEKGESFLQKMVDGDATRTQRIKDGRRVMAAAEAEAHHDRSIAGTTRKATSYRTAEATASGFTSLEEEQAYLAEMRALPEKTRAEDAAQQSIARAEAARVEAIQRMQAAEKRDRARQEVELEREQARQQREYQAADDARYLAFTESQLPADMDPILRAKALQME